MRNTRPTGLPILAALVLGITFSTNAQDTEYVWNSYDGGAYNGALGPPSGLFPITGTIILDSPSSSGGSLSDIVSLSLSSGLSGSYAVNPTGASGFEDGLYYTISLGTPFTWTPTRITDMDITVTANFPSPPFGNGFTDYVLPMDASPLGGGSVDLDNVFGNGESIDPLGAWRGSPVPEVFSTTALLFLSMVILSVGRHYLLREAIRVI
jgi:hypothetical protein